LPSQELTLAPLVEDRILSVRGLNVILDADLADLYGVETRVLNQAVRRNAERFPDDFMFRLSKEEFAVLRSQSVTSSWGGRRTPPYAFTEHGSLMAANVLRSERAIQMGVFVIRAFVRLRSMLSQQAEILKKLEAIEDRVSAHDGSIQGIVTAIRQLMAPGPRTPRIGFDAEQLPPIGT
jgi:phage regulator Rha-like protein